MAMACEYSRPSVLRLVYMYGPTPGCAYQGEGFKPSAKGWQFNLGLR